MTVEGYLAMWVQWQRSWSAADELGFPKAHPMFKNLRSGVAGNDTFDHLCEQADTWAAHVIDAVIDGLSPIERAAIYHKHLAAVFRGRDLDAAYDQAIAALERGIAAKGVAVDA